MEERPPPPAGDHARPQRHEEPEGQGIHYGDAPEVVAAIEAQWAVHQWLAAKGVLSPWVFPSSARSGRRRDDVVSQAWVNATKAAGCPGPIFHDFRPTVVRDLTRAGVTDTTAMQITRHKTAAVFQRYNISSDTDRRAAMKRVAEAVR